MLKIICIIILISVQLTEAKKKQKPVTTIQKATTKISEFLKDVTDFFKDVLDAITDVFTVGKPKKKHSSKNGGGGSTKKNRKKKNSNWGIGNLLNFRSGLKLFEDSIMMFDMARSMVDDVTPLMPNVTVGRFVHVLLNRMVPELMDLRSQDENI